MSVKELGRYQSMDYPDKTMDQVHTMFRRRERSNLRFHEKMEDLRGSVEDYGIKEPVVVDAEGRTNGGYPLFGNGHHRFSAAKSLRMKQLPVQSVWGNGSGQE